MIEYFAPGFVYTVFKDIAAKFAGRRRKLTTSEIVELRKKWKGEFEPRLWADYQKKLRNDVIIRDMKRVDNYPNIDDHAKGISPWFRAGVVGTYHRGIYVGLGVGGLTQHSDGVRWRYTNYGAGEKEQINGGLSRCPRFP